MSDFKLHFCCTYVHTSTANVLDLYAVAKDFNFVTLDEYLFLKILAFYFHKF